MPIDCAYVTAYVKSYRQTVPRVFFKSHGVSKMVLMKCCSCRESKHRVQPNYNILSDKKYSTAA